MNDCVAYEFGTGGMIKYLKGEVEVFPNVVSVKHLAHDQAKGTRWMVTKINMRFVIDIQMEDK